MVVGLALYHSISGVKIHDVEDNFSIENIVPLISLLQSEWPFFFHFATVYIHFSLETRNTIQVCY
jgi:hypothetical protein